MKLTSFESLAVHAGHENNDIHHAHHTPLYQSSTYVLESSEIAEELFSGQRSGYMYGRFASPNMKECEQKIVALETFETGIEASAILHASGMGAISTLLSGTLQHGDIVLAQQNLYGGTVAYFEKVLSKHHITTIFADFSKLNELEDMIKKNPAIRMLYMETPDNPMSRCVDMKACCDIAKKYNIKTAIDNTVATPYLQRPFAFGLDFIVHSATKYLNGQGTHTCGFLLGKDVALMERIRNIDFRLLGANVGAVDAMLLNNGMKTLPLRMDKHAANAKALTAFLSKHPTIQKVHHCLLEGHPDFLIAQKQLRGYTSCFSFDIKGDKQTAFKFLNNLNLCTHAVSLGNVDTLICHPYSTTHKPMSDQQKQRSGITPSTIRISVGIEGIDDIIADISQSLDRL